MGKFDRVNLTRDPATAARDSMVNAAQSLQSSLYQRMRKARGNSGAGTTGWMLIRLAQPSHIDHQEAVEAVEALPSSELNELLLVARDARKAMRTTESRDLGDAVAAAIHEAYNIRRALEAIHSERGVGE